MKGIKNHNPMIASNRFMACGIFTMVILTTLLIRLWYVQVYRGDYYKNISQRNRIRKIETPAPRGVIYDRHGKVVLGNRPFFDLVYIRQFVKDEEMTFRILSRLLHIPTSQFQRRMRIAGGGPRYLPIILKRNLSINEVSVIESNKMFLPGVDVEVAPRRDYQLALPPHMVGYLSEVDSRTLRRKNKVFKENPYNPGDLIGKQGLEKVWEQYLRGKRGYRFIQVDALGRKTKKQDLVDWELPLQRATPGNDLELTLDLELQYAVHEAFKGKYGAAIVLNAKTGEILAMESSPGFDPTMYQEGLSREEWQALISNPFNPLYDKTTGGEYPPGSVYKAVVAIAALNENIASESVTITCPGYYVLGDQTFHCWDRGGHGVVNLRRAMMKSCDTYFYEIGVQLGVDKIAEYSLKLGLGQKLGINLNTEKPGLIPTSAWKQFTQRVPWTKGDTPNIAIGQGFNLVTPMQLAALYATISNGGKVNRPYLVKKITNHYGEIIKVQETYTKWQITDIRPEVFARVRNYLKEVVMNKEGTGKNARVEGVTVAGKTGSAQVVSLKKNRNFDDVSMKWKEHALFAAFSPAEDAEIAIAIVSENDAIGGGGAAAAPVAGEIIKAYWDLKKSRIEKGGRLSKTNPTLKKERASEQR